MACQVLLGMIVALGCVGDAPPGGDRSLRAAGSGAVLAPAEATPRVAFASVEGRSGSAMTGGVTFTAEGEAEEAPLAVAIALTGAAPGNHAIFLHEAGDCSAPDATSAAGWFGPPTPPALPSPGTGPHASAGPPAGYLGFVTVGADGRGAKDLTLRAYTLGEGPASLLERAVVVYERAPDFTRGEQPGARLACGVIRR